MAFTWDQASLPRNCRINALVAYDSEGFWKIWRSMPSAWLLALPIRAFRVSNSPNGPCSGGNAE